MATVASGKSNVGVGEMVAVAVMVGVCVLVGVSVTVGVSVIVAVAVAVAVGVLVGVDVGKGVGVAVGVVVARNEMGMLHALSESTRMNREILASNELCLNAKVCFSPGSFEIMPGILSDTMTTFNGTLDLLPR